MSKPILKVENRDRCLILTIDREEAGNSLSAETADAILAAIAPLAGRGDGRTAPAHDEDPRTVILTGAGNKFFCAGGDIKRYRSLRTGGQVQDVFKGPRRLMDALEDLPLPVIAAINGYALGGGAELMLAADIRIASDCARIGFPQSRLGIIPGFHGVQRLARDIGHARAMALLLSGDMQSAARAAELGLVHDVVAPDDLLPAALKYAHSLEVCGPLALAGTKRVLHSVSRDNEAASRQVADEVLIDLWLSEDHREAEAAFEEKRQPDFKGR